MAKSYKPTPAEVDAFRRIDASSGATAGGTNPFTTAEVEALKAVAARELSRPPTLRSGSVVAVSYQVDAGLRDGLRRYAEAQGLNAGEALNRAIEQYLSSKAG